MTPTFSLIAPFFRPVQKLLKEPTAFLLFFDTEGKKRPANNKQTKSYFFFHFLEKLLYFFYLFWLVICGSCVNPIGSDLMDRRSLGSPSLCAFLFCVFYPFLVFDTFHTHLTQSAAGQPSIISICVSAVVY